MTSRRSLLFAVQALAVGFAALALTPAADASLVYTIERTDSAFTTSLGGYQLVSTSAAPSTSVQFNYEAGVIVTMGGTLSTIGASDFGLSPADALLLQIMSLGSSQQNLSGLKSFVVDNETQVISGVTGPLYFRVNVSQDAFVKPTTNPLGFDISLTQQSETDSSSQFQATLTTDGGANSGSLGPITGGPTTATAGSIPVTNNSLGVFTVLGTTFLTLDVTGDGGLESGITATGQANVTATPEPATLLSALVGLGLAAGVSRLRRRKAD